MRKLIYIPIISLLVLACKKPYDDPPVKSGISHLIVECTITNDQPPYSVKLTKSTGYNNPNKNSVVTNAKISIFDNLGNVENIIESPKSSGLYQTSANGMRGQIGRSYKMKITLTNAKNVVINTYESDWVTLNESPVLDSIYAEKGQIQTLLQESDGTYYTTTTLGLNMYITAHPPENQDYYYKFKASMIQQYTKNYYPYPKGRYDSQPIPVTLYGWYTNDVSIDKDLRAGSSQYYTPIKNFFVGFIPEFYSIYTDTFNDAPVTAGAAITLNIYSVSKKIYQIFTEENSQTKPSNSIFDPIPTQLESNIKCLNDSTQKVLGYFNAASVVHNHHFFLWFEGSEKIYSHNIDTLPPDISPSGVDTVSPPNFWVNPYF